MSEPLTRAREVHEAADRRTYRDAGDFARSDYWAEMRFEHNTYAALLDVVEKAKDVRSGVSTDDHQQVWLHGDHLALRIWDFDAALATLEARIKEETDE